MVSLKEVVDKYLQHAGKFGESVQLSAFGYSPEETSRLFSSLDEDYHISRFLTYSTADGPRYSVSGNPVTHIRIEDSIRSIL